MLPSIDIRIQNLIKAIEQVVLPAVDTSNKLAQEQAQLVAAHLRVLSQQWDKAQRYELQSLRAMHQLAQRLTAEAGGGERTRDAARNLIAEADAIDYAVLDSASAAAAKIRDLGTAVDALIFAISDDGSERCRSSLKDEILSYAQRQARRERIWFSGTGLDPDGQQLPSIDAMLSSP